MASISDKTPWIETPLIWSKNLSHLVGCNVYLKLENTQPCGSFKSRGMGAFVRAHLPKEHETEPHTNGAHRDQRNTPHQKAHFFCSSGGNAGLGCVCAAVTLECPATIVVPTSTSDYMISKLRAAGAAEVIQKGASWMEADEFLNKELLPQARSRGETAVYVPPFDHPDIWAGHSTMIDELVRQLPQVDQHYPSDTVPSSTVNPDGGSEVMLPDAVVCSVGGGGLLNGVMEGLDRYRSRSKTSPKVIAVETVGADSLAKSVEAGELITLPKITSIATTLGARRVSRQTFEHAAHSGHVKCAVLTDREAVEGCRRFADEERYLVEPSCGVCLATCYTGRLKELLPDLKPTSRVVVIVCGGSGLSLDIMNKYIQDQLA